MTTAPPTFRLLPIWARAYLALLFVAAPAAVVALSLGQDVSADWYLLGLGVLLCLVAGAFEVFAPGNFSFQPSLVFFFWGAVLLPAWAMPLLAVASMAAGWVRHGFRWYMPAFNIANYLLTGSLAWLVAGLGEQPSQGVGPMARLVAAAVAAVALNHMLLIGVISSARGRSLRDSAGQLRESAPLDLALALTGAALAELWLVSPEMSIFAVGPMVLIHQALWVPTLRMRSRTDAKTGLFHSEHFRQETEDALTAAQRNGDSLAIVMLDLDHLRTVNNRFGHLAGDELIEAAARLVAELAGRSGVAARFGGEEFSLLLPGATGEEAHAVAEELRTRLQGQEWRWGDGRPFIATISAGIAEFPANGTSVDALIAAADAALYDAKLGGRNRVRSAVPDGMRTSLHDDALGLPPLAVVRWPEPGENHLPVPAAAARHAEPAPPSAPASTGGVAPDHEDDAGEAAAPAGAHRRFVPYLVGVLLAGALAAVLLSDPARIADAPTLFGLLIVSMLVLEHVAIDLFDRAHISPASVPTLVLAFLFGPLGPLCAEACSTAMRFVRREPAIKAGFDLGSLGLAGAAAAVAFSAVGSGHVAAGDVGFTLVAAAAGGLAYYVVNAGTLASVMALAEGDSLRRVFSERLAWLWPHYVGFGLTAGAVVVVEHDHGPLSLAFFAAPLVVLWIAEQQYVDRSRDSVNELRSQRDELQTTNGRLRRALATNDKLLQTMQRSYLSTITSLARTIEAKDPYTGGHTERVARIARLLSGQFGMSPADLRAVAVGAVIHDIGKIGIADQILTKPGRLTDEEFAEMRRHPEISSYIVSDLELPPIVKQMVRSHHERYDGSGYPDRLAGEEIPLAARVLAVADSLDAMTSQRPYSAAMPLAIAVDEIIAQKGRQFCPRVVDAFLVCLEKDATLDGQYVSEPPSLKTA